MKKFDLIIKNGKVVTPLGVINTDIAVQGEKIAAIGEFGTFQEAEQVVNAQGKLVFPGGIDTHSHFELMFMGERPPETWDIGTTASAIGGTTTTIDFASQDKGETLFAAAKKQLDRASKLSVIDFTTKPILCDLTDMEKELAGIEECVKYGIRAFKGATIYRKVGWYENDWQIYQIMRKIKELGAMMTYHAENGLIGEEMQVELVNHGKTDPKYHAIAKPNFVEDMDILKLMMIAQELGTKTYIVHTSTRNGPTLIDSFRKKNLPVYCETCTHYLWLTDSTFEPKLPRGIMYMCSPPLRKQADIEALWDGIKAGTVQTVGSDHVAFTKAQKEAHCESFKDIPNGFPGCEVRLPIVFQEGVLKRNLSLEKFAEVTATNAAKIFGLYPKKGVLLPGSDADIVVFDPNKKHSLNAKDLHMGTDLSVFEGMEVTGWPTMTILRGQIIVENEKFKGKAGQGQFLKV
jgi:dihydropyrimidinase